MKWLFAYLIKIISLAYSPRDKSSNATDQNFRHDTEKSNTHKPQPIKKIK